MTDRDAMLDLDPPARQVKALLNGITEADFSNPTPCGEMSVAALLDHFMGLTMDVYNHPPGKFNRRSRSGWTSTAIGRPS